MGMAAILVMWTGPFEQNFFPLSMETPYDIWLLLGWVASEEKLFEYVDDVQWTTDNRGLPII